MMPSKALLKDMIIFIKHCEKIGSRYYLNSKNNLLINSKYSEQFKESDISLSKIYNRVDNMYMVVYEITGVLDDFKVYEQLHNQFIEKLDKTVALLEPKFYHTPLKLESIK